MGPWKQFESTVVRLKGSYEDTGSVVCLITKGRQLEWNFEELKPASHVGPLEVVVNVTLKLACQVLDANPTVNSFSWYKGSSTTSIGMLSNFSISKVIRTDSGEYRCEGSNGIGQNGVDTVYVNVLCEYQLYYNIMHNRYVDIF
jgi:hypothetical protein